MAASPAVANDVAELLVFLARVLGSERALTGVLAGLGPEVVGAALEQGEPSRFSMQTRDDLRADPVLCTTCAGHVLLAVANVAALVVLVLLLRGRLPVGHSSPEPTADRPPPVQVGLRFGVF